MNNNEEIREQPSQNGTVTMREDQSGKTFVRDGKVWTVWNPRATLDFITHNFFSICFVIFMTWLMTLIFFSSHEIKISDGKLKIWSPQEEYEKMADEYLERHFNDFWSEMNPGENYEPVD